MVSLELIRVTVAADIAAVPETKADILLVVDRDTTVPDATLILPVNPIRGQMIGISTRVQITALTLDSGGIPIVGYSAPFTMAANTVFWRIYEDVANKWFPY